ncbi:S-layer protein sap precursor [Clostridium acetireducens DSM 10703]|uniref:S-layer protein sap n=1 Tax=Clostridium acetireducens DSM 10703 TaxID=1121290 RepID=A0A1E8EXZ3_9CLOT|nr:hypothetical protein [Clostridium acetireducens]OFI05816.1 S-layer protein sap precursor [Clostridium acetireducens DSM 10703]
MNKKIKKSLAVLSSAAIGGLIAAAISSTAYAAADKVLVTDDKGNYFEYSLKELNTAAEDDAVGIESPLFKHYVGKTVVAFHDDKINDYVDVEKVNIAAEDATIEGKVFELDTFTENAKAEDIIKVDGNVSEVDKDGNVVTPGDEDLKVESISAIDANTIKVTFQGQEPVEVKLGAPLKEGQIDVNFTYEGKQYTGKLAEAYTEALKVNSVSAINSTQAEVKFSKEVKEVKPANFKVTDKDGNLVFVSKVELNGAKDVATLTFVDSLKEGKYNVEVKDIERLEKTANVEFEYKKAEAAKVEFTQTTVAPKSDLKEAVKVTDALGRDVTKEHTVTFETPNADVVAEDGTVGDVNDKSVIVVAVVKDGEKTVKSAKTTIKVSKEAPAKYAGSYVYKTSAVTNTKAFNELKDDEKVSYVFKGDKLKKLAVYYVDQYGNDDNDAANAVTQFNGEDQPKLENLAPTVAIVENDGTIKPISVGKAYVKVTQGEIVQVIEIEVKEDAKVATMELENKDVSVVEGKTDEVKVTFKDQYGNKLSETPEVKIAGKEVSKNDYVEATAKADAIEIKGLKEGTATLEVRYKEEAKKIDLKETINVTVVKAGDLAEYKVAVKDVKLDAGNEDGEKADKDKAPKSTTVTVDKVDTNGNKLGEATNVGLTEVDEDGKKVVEDNKVKIDGQNLKVTAEKAGKAYIKVSVGSLVIDTVEIEIVNTESVATSVDFERNDLAYTGALKEGKVEFTLAENKAASKLEDLTADLKTIVKVKDQFGKEIENGADNLSIVYTLTNAKGLTRTDNLKGIKSVEEAKASVDVVITSIKAGSDELIKEPVVVKVALDQTKALEDKKAAEEKALDEAKAELKTAIGTAKAKKEEGKEYKKSSVEVFYKAIEEAETALNAEEATVETLNAAKEEVAKAELEEKEEATIPSITKIETSDAKEFTFTFGSESELAEGVTVTIDGKELAENKITLEQAVTTGNTIEVVITVPATDDAKAGTKTITYTVTSSGDEANTTWTVAKKAEA